MSFEQRPEAVGESQTEPSTATLPERRGRRTVSQMSRAVAFVGALLTFTGGLNAIRGLDDLSEVDKRLAADIHHSGLADIDAGIGDGKDDLGDLAAMLEGIRPVVQEAADSAERTGDEIASNVAAGLVGGVLMVGSLGSDWALNRDRKRQNRYSSAQKKHFPGNVSGSRYVKFPALAAAAALTACSPLADRAAGATDAAVTSLPGDGLTTLSSPLTDPLSARVRGSVVQDITDEIKVSLPNAAEYAETIGFDASAVERMINE